MNVEIKNHRIPWGVFREIFTLLIWSAILVVAAFGWGIIYENRRSEDLRKEVYKLEYKMRDANGRLTVIEGKLPRH